MACLSSLRPSRAARVIRIRIMTPDVKRDPHNIKVSSRDHTPTGIGNRCRVTGRPAGLCWRAGSKKSGTIYQKNREKRMAELVE